MNFVPHYPTPPPGYMPYDYYRTPPTSPEKGTNYYSPRYSSHPATPSPRPLPKGHTRRASHAVPPQYSPYQSPRGGNFPGHEYPWYYATPHRPVSDPEENPLPFSTPSIDSGPIPTDETLEHPARRPRAPTITIDTSAVDSEKTPRGRPHNGGFLSVPGARSRGNSIDSSTTEIGGTAPVDTYQPSLQGDTLIGDHGPKNVLDEDALRPDPGTEQDFVVEDNKFAFSPGQLGKLLNPKSLAAFHAIGGWGGLEKGLRTDRKAGLSIDEQRLDSSVAFDGVAAVSGQYQIFEIPSILGNIHSVNALGDYCAKRNFIKEEYAMQLGLDIDRNETMDVTIGSGKKVTTTGVTKTSLRFKDESISYPLVFHILPRCIQNVILGKGFLKATNTFSSLTNRARRVKQRILKGISRRHFLYLGDSAPRFEGLVNGLPQEALADSGAKVMVMDEDYARSIGLSIAEGRKHRTKLRFADDSTAYTSGVTYGVQWEFGHGGASEKYMLDFNILKNAPAKVILSDEFLFGTEAYSEYECFLVDDDDDDEDAYFFAIDVDANYSSQVHINMSSMANMRHAEIVRRGEKEDEIAKLPLAMQGDAWRKEEERRLHWEQSYRAMQLQQTILQAAAALLPSNTPSNATDPALAGGAASPQPSSPKVSKRSRWRFKLKRKSVT